LYEDLVVSIIHSPAPIEVKSRLNGICDEDFIVGLNETLKIGIFNEAISVCISRDVLNSLLHPSSEDSRKGDTHSSPEALCGSGSDRDHESPLLNFVLNRRKNSDAANGKHLNRLIEVKSKLRRRELCGKASGRSLSNLRPCLKVL
jgi:hypothetical protein